MGRRAEGSEGPTEKQKMFAREYVIDFDATKAAVRAGYSQRTAGQIGHELLKRPDVQAFLREAVAKKVEELDVTAQDVLMQFRRVGFVDFRRAFNEHGGLLPIHEIPDDVAPAIASVEVEEIWDGRGDQRKQIGVLKKVKFWNRNEANTALGKYFKLFVEQHEHKIQGLSDEKRAELILAIVNRGLEAKKAAEASK